MKRVGVVLCGCGRFDGSEIHESVLTLLHLQRAGARPLCMAPDAEQWAVCDHFDGKPREGETRNMLHEAARIARGDVVALGALGAGDMDALILPGGTGVTRNLCDFKEKGAGARVRPELAALIREVHAAGKPIGAICISPVLIALVLGEKKPLLTLGKMNRSAEKASVHGARFVPCATESVVVDEENRIVSTPAYVTARHIGEADAGIARLVAEVLRRTE